MTSSPISTRIAAGRAGAAWAGAVPNGLETSGRFGVPKIGAGIPLGVNPGRPVWGAARGGAEATGADAAATGTLATGRGAADAEGNGAATGAWL